MGNVKTASSRLLAAIMALCLAAVMAVGASLVFAPTQQAYADTNQSVLDQRSGVFKFNWGYKNEYVGRGSAFLINEDTIVTAYHCVRPSDEEIAFIANNIYKVDADEFLNNMVYTVTITGDFQVPATLERFSEKQDFAILKLEQKLNGVNALKLRNSKEVDASEVVYSLGFPSSSEQEAVITYSVNDVTVMQGTVSKPEGQMNFTYEPMFRNVPGQQCSGSFIMSTCTIDQGSSGGPMVDTNGNAIGVCVAGDSNFFYAASSSVLMDALDTMGYDYVKVDENVEPVPVPVPEPHQLSFSALDAAIAQAEALAPNASKYTEDSYKAVTAALDAAKKARETTLDNPSDEAAFKAAQDEIDAATKALTEAMDSNHLKEAPQGPDTGMIIAIVVGVIVVIAIIILIVVMRGRNKKQEETPTVPLNAAAAAPAQPALQSGGAQSWQKPGAAAAAPAGAPETTILEDEANDTVILFQAASGGSLTRMSTNEQIPINSAEFTIGRERSKVNYCLEGNSSISRVHVRIVVRDGKVYCIDNKAANGTYINGVKCRPGEEVLLKSGDIITLADEKFKYNA